MSTYFQTIIIMMALSHLLLVLASELWNEHTQKLLRMLCGTVMLLTILSPVKGTAESIGHAVSDILSEAAETEEREDTVNRTDAILDSSCSYIAEKWFEHISETYAVKRSQIRLVFETDENMRILSAEIILSDCPYALRRKIEKEMTEQTDLNITVKGE